MISPTGKGIREDSAGSGMWNSKRGNRKHKGVDFVCTPGQVVIAPFDMYIERTARPYAGEEYSGIAWANDHMKGKMFYFVPDRTVIYVTKGERIGIAQAIWEKYGGSMENHIHFQIDSIDPLLFITLDTLSFI